MNGVIKKCATCGADFSPEHLGMKSCSKRCRGQAYLKECGMTGQYPGLPTGTAGAIGELRVSIDLLSKGYEVFRALSSSCSCDLALLRGSKVVRVEVRTGYRNLKTGTLSTCWPKKSERFDILAIVLPTEIVYNPPLEESVPADG